jgi:hypothetical protein
MKRLAQSIVLLLSMGSAILPCAWSRSPCDSVDRQLTDKRKAELAPEIAKQLDVEKVDVLKSFRFEGWTILYVDSHAADEEFLFYSHDPLNSHCVTTWGGIAMKNEQRSIRAWTLKDAPGIPPKLAGCFAWYVTNSGWK